MAPANERLTHHHLTPRCICKVWKIPRRVMNNANNIEILPNNTHEEQDRVVPMLLQRAIFQAEGGIVDFGTHNNEMIIFERGMPKSGEMV